MAGEDEVLRLTVEVREGLANIKRFESEYRESLKQLAAATKAGMDPASAEFLALRARALEAGTAFVQAGEQGGVAMRRLAELTGKGGTEIKALEGNLSIARAELDRFHREANEGGARLVDNFNSIKAAVIAIGTSFAAVKIRDFFGDAIEQASGAQDALTEVERLVRITGGSAGRTAEQLRETAGVLSELSGFDDDEILGETTATLLRFGTVQGEVFDRAQRDSVDLALVLKTDLSSAAETLGKALSIPGEGLRALKAAGADFTDSERESLQIMAESGRAAEAQAIILGRLEKATRDTAESLRSNLSGTLRALKTDWEDLKQAFGEGFTAELTAGIDDAAGGLERAKEGAGGLGRLVGSLVAVLTPFIPLIEKVGAVMAATWSNSLRATTFLVAGITDLGTTFAGMVVRMADLAAKLPFGGVFAEVARQARLAQVGIQEFGGGAVKDLNAAADAAGAASNALWTGGGSLAKAASGAADAVGGPNGLVPNLAALKKAQEEAAKEAERRAKEIATAYAGMAEEVSTIFSQLRETLSEGQEGDAAKAVKQLQAEYDKLTDKVQNSGAEVARIEELQSLIADKRREAVAEAEAAAKESGAEVADSFEQMVLGNTKLIEGLSHLPAASQEAFVRLAQGFQESADAGRATEESLESFGNAVARIFEAAGINVAGLKAELTGTADLASQLQAKIADATGVRQAAGKGDPQQQAQQQAQAQQVVASAATETTRVLADQAIVFDDVIQSTGNTTAELVHLGDAAGDASRQAAPLGQSLAQAAESSKKLREETQAATTVTNATVQAVATLTDTEKRRITTNEELSEALSGFKARQDDVNSSVVGAGQAQGELAQATTDTAAAMGQASEALAKLKEENPAEFWRLATEAADAYGKMIQRNNGPEYLGETLRLCGEILKAMEQMAA